MSESPAGARVTVTTSWDDEDRTGLKVAELLTRHGLPGTFYVPTGKLGEQSCLGVDDLRALSRAGFEIGAHSVSHAILTELDSTRLACEVGDCKKTLQNILGAEVTMFCYPKGRFNRAVIREVELAGYQGARSTQMLAKTGAVQRFAIPTTLQAYPHTQANYIRNLVRMGAVRVLLTSIADLLRFENWLQLGKSTFDRVLRDGGVWHLYGHPWEIQKLDLWSQLDEMFAHVSRRSGVRYVTNGGLVEVMKGEGPNRTEGVTATPPQSVIR